MQAYGGNPYQQNPNQHQNQPIQVATVTEEGGPNEKIATASTVREAPTATTTNPWHTPAPAGGGGRGWNTGGVSGGVNASPAQAASFFIFLAACIAVPLLVVNGIFDSEFSTRSPTPFPTSPPVDVVVCPTVFDGDSKNEVLTSCGTDGCGGSIEWCGLSDATSYRLIVSVKGDYDLPGEEITVNFGGFIDVASTGVSCSSTFGQVSDRTANPTGGILLMTYLNSPSVNDICLGSLATEMNATLIQL